MVAQYKFELRRVRLNSGGYDSAGRYFGRDIPLYEWSGEVDALTIEGEPTVKYKTGYLRACDRDDAKTRVRQMYPQARFYR